MMKLADKEILEDFNAFMDKMVERGYSTEEQANHAKKLSKELGYSQSGYRQRWIWTLIAKAKQKGII